MNIALYGDLHGRVLLPFYLAQRWQEAHGEELHEALCVGDVGVYRSFQAMEKTSQRWARKHPEELGFSKFLHCLDLRSQCLVPHPAADAVLGATRCDLLFVPGNHEEHRYLDELWARYARRLDRPLAVDRAWEGLERGRYSEGQFSGYGRVHCLPQGRTVELSGPFDEQTAESAPGIRLHAINGLDAYTPPDAWSAPDQPIDVLLSHETYAGRLRGCDPSGRRDSYGSAALLELIRRAGPAYHFFGHHHWYYPEVELDNLRGGVTRSVGLNQVFFESHGATINRGCFGVLRTTDAGDLAFEIVEDDWFLGLRYGDCAAFM